MHVLTLLFVWFVDQACGTIYTNAIGSYIGVYDDSSTYTWYTGLAYCESTFGTSLASIHSSSDETAANLARYTTSYKAWIGLNDVSNEGTWVWSDGTPYDYLITWASGQPDNANSDEDCGEFFAYTYTAINDRPCSYAQQQFICNAPTPSPTENPSDKPTVNPTIKPTANPTSNPSVMPSNNPTKEPSLMPSNEPSNKPSNYPSIKPSNEPSNQPSNMPPNVPSALVTSEIENEKDDSSLSSDNNNSGNEMDLFDNWLFWVLIIFCGLICICMCLISIITSYCYISEKRKRKRMEKKQSASSELQMMQILQEIQKSMSQNSMGTNKLGTNVVTSMAINGKIELPNQPSVNISMMNGDGLEFENENENDDDIDVTYQKKIVNQTVDQAGEGVVSGESR